MVIYPYQVLREREREKKKKTSYVLAFNSSFLTIWTLLGLGHDISNAFVLFRAKISGPVRVISFIYCKHFMYRTSLLSHL